VQGRIADRDAADEDGLEPRHGRQCPGAAHLKFDVSYRRQRFFGGKFVRDRPARGARNEAQTLLPFQIVDLVNHAVDLIRERRSLRPHIAIIFQTAVGAFDHARLRTDLESPVAQHLQGFAVLRG